MKPLVGSCLCLCRACGHDTTGGRSLGLGRPPAQEENRKFEPGHQPGLKAGPTTSPPFVAGCLRGRFDFALSENPLSHNTAAKLPMEDNSEAELHKTPKGCTQKDPGNSNPTRSTPRDPCTPSSSAPRCQKKSPPHKTIEWPCRQTYIPVLGK